MDNFDALEKILQAMHHIYEMDDESDSSLRWVFGTDNASSDFDATATQAGINPDTFKRGILSRSELARKYFQTNSQN